MTLNLICFLLSIALIINAIAYFYVAAIAFSMKRKKETIIFVIIGIVCLLFSFTWLYYNVTI